MEAKQVEKILSDERLYLNSKAKIYMLKCFVELDCFTRFMSFMSRQPYDYDEISEFMGFHKICPSHETYSKSKNKEKYRSEILAFCKAELDSLLKKDEQGKIGSHKTLTNNLRLLADTLHLNDAEFALLHTTAIVQEVVEFRDFLETFGNIGRRESALMISKLLGFSYEEISNALSDDGILRQLEIIRSYRKSISLALDFERGDFIDILLNEHRSKNELTWITNNVHSIDSALIRRFDFAIAMNAPKKGVRKAMLEKICGEKLDKKTRKLVQKSPNLAPALINRANEISSVISGDFSKNFLMLLNNTLKAQGYCEIKKAKKSKDSANALPKSYSVDFINADCDISRVASGLSANPNARICLYGLSGTGKSAFAQFIAKSLKRPCIIKAVSDLESMWVGETEKNIARAFKEAKDKKAVLVFDEVDSFLRDRRLAVRGFEATKVNEMLLQMEKFNGIFVATTNLMDNIDKAALRRFDLKVEFKALNPAQRVNLFKKECALLGLKCESRAKESVERLELLTPGDFAAVKRQNKFSKVKDAMDFYARLCEEVKVKDLREGSANMGVGFLR